MPPTKRERRPTREKPQLIADELRSLILEGTLSEGDSLGHEPDLVERFGVSRPSLREALRILEAEGLITVVRGALGGVVVHEPSGRMTARTASMVLRARNVPLADVYDARRMIEPMVAASLARSPRRKAVARELTQLIDEQEAVVDDPTAYGAANAHFHDRLVALGGNETMTIVAEMLSEIVTQAVTALAGSPPSEQSLKTRRRGVRSQRRLVELVLEGDAAGAEEHWQRHLEVAGRILLGRRSTSVVSALEHC